MFIDFLKLSDEHKAEIRTVYQNDPDSNLARFAFWVKKDGTMSRKKGHHRMTEAEGKKLDDWLVDDRAHSKTSFPDYVLGKFSL